MSKRDIPDERTYPKKLLIIFQKVHTHEFVAKKLEAIRAKISRDDWTKSSFEEFSKSFGFDQVREA